MEAEQVVVQSLPPQTPTPPQEYVVVAVAQVAREAPLLDAQMVLLEAMVLSSFATQQMCWMHSPHPLSVCKAVTSLMIFKTSTQVVAHGLTVRTTVKMSSHSAVRQLLEHLQLVRARLFAQ